MTIRTRLPLCASIALLAGCIKEPTVPQCLPVSFTKVSTSGDTVTTSTGLRYIERVAGNGVATEWCRPVAIHYTGYLLDGTMFDSSRDLDRPLIFTPGLDDLIDGITQGVIGLRIGGTRRLIISPQLGFGPDPRRNATGDIIVPGNSTVVFDIDVLQISQ
jgi:peptidylprolyl isomerase